MIPQAFIDEVQTRTDIADIVGSYIPLKKMGRNFKGLCPFHGEKTPSFVVSPQKQIFHCFGCGAGGGALQFLMLYEKVTFPEAVEILAKRLGLIMPQQRDDASQLKEKLYDVAQEAALFFHKNLLEHAAAGPVRKYLTGRGLDSEVIKKFRIGFAFGRATLLDHLRSKGFSLETIERAALITPRNPGYRDLFMDRVMFPVCDVRGRIIAFGGRLWRDNPQAPKYINSPEGVLYSKRDHLFGLHYSKDDITKHDAVIVVEGYLDMITPFAHGITNIVASLGTALTLEQIRILKRYTSNIILLFDSDTAGQRATLRALDLALEQDVTVKIVSLPKGYDPDSLVRAKGAAALVQLLDSKKDFFDYKLEFLAQTLDIQSIEGKTKIAQEMLVTIGKLQSEVQRYQYIRRLAQVLDIKEEVMIAESRKFFPREPVSTRPPESSHAPAGQESVSITEKVLIKFMLTSSKALALVRKNLDERDFFSSLARKTVAYFFKHYVDVPEYSAAKIVSGIDDKEIASFVSAMLMDDEIAPDKELFKSSFTKLMARHARKLKDNVRSQIKDAEAKGDTERLQVLVNQYVKINSEGKNE